MANKSVTLVAVADLIPYEKNAKKHSPEQVEKLSALINKYGWTAPIVVDKNLVIIAGHGRRLAALNLGLEKVPVIIRDDLSEADVIALRLADNRIASTEYDLQLEQAELQILNEMDIGIDLTILGFSEHEINFSTGDLIEMDDTIFVDDVGAAVEKQRTENEEKTREVDDVAAPVADALGFKRVTIAESRQIRDLMGRMEKTTGKKGVEALISFVSEALDVAA
ncbi:ParB N-terminal domain-containing protein [Rhizobium bangladeshense]|uniref:ParB/Srx family N-terminal domain-containing protein n=1 Tax=Rhizobium TaxID=379 RepID=UPI001C83E30F|nr:MULTISPECIES: ParB/Srx family N-terminal domain-containing protein [Rhizobium]MBX4911344.1 ParB N-terminal domain-containing protein [Rhizobium bangladeshense]MBX5130804.1 ParB N-terminal domain-containing protein [Rhizobium lentis]